MDWSKIAWVIGGGVLISVARSLLAAITTDVANRISRTMFFIRLFDYATRYILRDPIWSGKWKISWDVESSTFPPTNLDTAEIWRCFNMIAAEGAGTTIKGARIPYGFIGKFSRDRNIITGIWFDRRNGNVGYHGAFQLRKQGSGDEAIGRWVGFSETIADVKSDRLRWEKV